jgi:hypothetical protein
MDVGDEKRPVSPRAVGCDHLGNISALVMSRA